MAAVWWRRVNGSGGCLARAVGGSVAISVGSERLWTSSLTQWVASDPVSAWWTSGVPGVGRKAGGGQLLHAADVVEYDLG